MGISLQRLTNKTATLYKKTEGATNEYGEKEISYSQSSSFKVCLQPKKQLEEIRIPGQVFLSPDDISHIVYCDYREDISIGDRLKIDSVYYEVKGISDEAGRKHHLKIFCKELQNV